MAAAGRELIRTIGLALALGLAMPALAQSSDQPIDVTAAPPPSADSVGPAQLRDFDLRGPGARQTERPTAPATVPATSASPTLTPPAPSVDQPTSRQATTARRTYL